MKNLCMVDKPKCCSAKMIADFANGTLSTEAKTWVLQHALDCKACRIALTAARDSVPPSPFAAPKDDDPSVPIEDSASASEASLPAAVFPDTASSAEQEETAITTGPGTKPKRHDTIREIPVGYSGLNRRVVEETRPVAESGAAGAPVGSPESRFVLERLLGRGATGEVFAARDLQLEQPVALKRFFRRYSQDPSMANQLKREIVLGRRVNHPNVVSVYDWGQMDGCQFYTMEFVDGETLSQRIRRGRPSLEEAWDIILQVCAGVAAAHAQQVIHRDLKPPNILITNDGVAKVVDFGLAHETARGAISREVPQGTPAYWAPEQAAGKTPTERSDVYALGVVALEVFTGQRMRPETRHLHHTWQEIPATVFTIIRRCLAVDPDDRPASAQEFLVALQRAKESETGDDRFVLLRSIGKGMASEVFEAEDRYLEQQVALKRFHPQAGRDPVKRQQWKKEIVLGRQVRHPNVVSVYDYGEIGDCPYFTMEYVEGGHLGERLSQGPLRPTEATDIFAQVCAGVAAVHEEGIVHRNMKPSAILLTKENVVKVADFGFALGETSGHMSRQMVVGAPQYWSPEQASGETLTPRSDVFALGILAVELFTGQIASDENIKEALTEIPAQLSPIIEQCLRAAPDERPSSAVELHELLQEVTGGKTRPADGTAEHGNEGRPAQRRPRLAFALALVVVFVAFVAIGSMVTSALTNQGGDQSTGGLAALSRSPEQGIHQPGAGGDGQGRSPETGARPLAAAQNNDSEPTTVTITLEGVPPQSVITVDGSRVAGPVLELPRSPESVELRIKNRAGREWSRSIVPTENQQILIELPLRRGKQRQGRRSHSAAAAVPATTPAPPPASKSPPALPPPARREPRAGKSGSQELPFVTDYD
jgi:serine/threonine-protein kinase